MYHLHGTIFVCQTVDMRIAGVQCGEAVFEPCIWCMCERVEAYNVCNLLCDVILFTPSSPAQTVLV